jgi:hypothetical protein
LSDAQHARHPLTLKRSEEGDNMSSEWLDIQSFVSDQEALRAINDLTIVTHLALARKEDIDDSSRSHEARDYLRRFLAELDQVLEGRRDEAVAAGVDPRMQELAESFEVARRDASRDRSVLLSVGPEAAQRLLDVKEPPARRELLKVLDELREMITRHQQAGNMAIFEDF